MQILWKEEVRIFAVIAFLYLSIENTRFYYVIFFTQHPQRSEQNVSVWASYPFRTYDISDILAFIVASLFWILIYFKGAEYLWNLKEENERHRE